MPCATCMVFMKNLLSETMLNRTMEKDARARDKRISMRHLLALALLLSLAPLGIAERATASAPADSLPRVAIQNRRIVIVRKGKFVKDFPSRRRAIINYPVIVGPRNSEVVRKLRALFEFKNIFETTLAEYREDTWLDEFGYKVNYNRNYLLDITFSQSGIGAYPDTHEKHFIINLRNGEVIRAADAFNESSLNEMAERVDKKLQAEIKQIQSENAEARDEGSRVLFDPLKFTAENLNEFSVSDKGITFLYDAGFPHAVQAWQPVGRYFFSYAELKPFIKRDGPLGMFVR